MTRQAPRKSLLLILILAYSLIVLCWGLARSPFTTTEAKNIYIGRGLTTAGNTGWSGPAGEITSVQQGAYSIAPLIISGAERYTGFYGSRFVSVMLGLLLVLLIFLTGNTSLYGKRGLLAAITFVFLGIPLQLSAFATSTPYTALFFAASILLIEAAAETASYRRRILMLLFSSLSLTAAVTMNYISMLFLVPLVLYVFLRHRFLHAGGFFLLPLAAALSVYDTAILPAGASIGSSLAFPLSHASADMLSSLNFTYIFNWLSMPYLLAIFGIFHREGGKKAFFAMLLSLPAFLVNFIDPDLNATHLAVLLATIFMAPAAALGIDHMGDIFSSHNPMASVKSLFIFAVLLVLWVFGLQQIKELNRNNPDLTDAVGFLRARNLDGVTILVDSDYGSPEYFYRYFLESGSRPPQVLPVVRATGEERKQVVAATRPEYVVLDDYHSDRSFTLASLDYLSQGFTVAKTYQMSLSSGIRTVKIFHKGVL
ncbi:MAG TPA: hypothetical protein VEP69_04970 [Thermodesulfovibrionales bacterium]|nr:hypothetical protein [Thermodesulfovibrionales bacterium]